MKKKDNRATQEPELDQPGAGLPAIELFVAKRMVAAKYRKATREGIAVEFEEERKRICKLASDVNVEAGSQQILVKRQRGMEDSSRFWSVYMVLDHLRIVNGAVANFIGLLGEGKVPDVQADTAKVKPDNIVGAEVIEAFNVACGEFTEVVDAIEDLNTSVQHPHPWFGPFDAGQWHHMAAFHMTLHRKQIEAIMEKLSG